MNGNFCFRDRDGHPNRDIVYTFIDGKEIYYTVYLEGLEPKSIKINRVWHESFLRQLVQI